MACKLTVKTADNQFHRYTNVHYTVDIENRCLIVVIDEKNEIVFPLINVLFYSVNS